MEMKTRVEEEWDEWDEWDEHGTKWRKMGKG